MRAPLIPQTQNKRFSADPARAVKWRGLSGRYYDMNEDQLDDFVLKDHELYLIAEGDNVRWIGTAHDVIEDQASRARFRAAVKVASSVLHFAAPSDAVECMKTKCDLEAGQLAGALTLVP